MSSTISSGVDNSLAQNCHVIKQSLLSKRSICLFLCYPENSSFDIIYKLAYHTIIKYMILYIRQRTNLQVND